MWFWQAVEAFDNEQRLRLLQVRVCVCVCVCVCVHLVFCCSLLLALPVCLMKASRL